ncbi:MAG: phosphoenolpyruvate synthase [Acaryochloris sp. RU_4_1]|nr:phosphoenolpyruvate synthase [Acaryochloris sp. RU_4_1]NJR55308.1 phosphoenolpyruvate synthase [Acaryochloris sp. CRU_2_0]
MKSTSKDSLVESLYWFDALPSIDPSVVGQAAMRLGQLAQVDCPVLSGAVLSAHALQQFCHSIPWASPFLSDFPHLTLRLQREHPLHLQAVADEICQGLETTPLPAHWLQRCVAELHCFSSAGIRLSPSLWLPPPWAEHTSSLVRLLSVQYCRLTPQSVGTAIKEVWKSLFQAQMLFLLQELAIPIDQLRLGIICQPVPTTPASGFLAVTQTHVYLQATYGLSVGIMTGEVLPDCYIYNRQAQCWQTEPGQITYAYQALSEQQALAPSTTAGLVGSPLETTPHNPFVLNSDHLGQLLDLANHIPVPSTSSVPVVEWMFTADSEGEPHPRHPRLQIIQVWPELPLPLPNFRKQANFYDLEKDQAPSLLAQGLGAAIGEITAPVLVIADRSSLLLQQAAGQIVVIESVIPADVSWLQQAAGLICASGSYTSHGAIMARELGVPAVVGVASALAIFQSGQKVFLEGTQGQVYAAGSMAKAAEANHRVTQHPPVDAELLRTQLWVNLSQLQLLTRALQLPVQGVGLLRAEWFILDICEGQLPQDWLHQRSAAKFAAHLSQHLYTFVQAWQPRPVFYRSLDLKNDALANTQPPNLSPTGHPLLGLRGVSHYVYDPTLFDLELQALAHLHRQGCQNIRLILPFIRSVEEFRFCRDRIQAAGLLNDSFQVWIMAEVPSVLFQLPEYVAAGVQGIAIGTNDLTQLILGVDRDHAYLAQHYGENHPAVLAAIAQLVQTAKELDIPCSICGQAPVRHPELIEQFVEWGVTAISVDMAAVAATQGAIAKAEQQQQSKQPVPVTPLVTQRVDGLR